MDLKAENIVLGEDFNMKLIDFDFAMKLKDTESLGKGTPNYRAPELIKGEAPNPAACDVFSAAIVLFVLKMGIIPYLEDKKFDGVNLFEALLSNPEKFWRQHETMGSGARNSSSFK